jgi:hypothetical protein
MLIFFLAFFFFLGYRRGSGSEHRPRARESRYIDAPLLLTAKGARRTNNSRALA